MDNGLVLVEVTLLLQETHAVQQAGRQTVSHQATSKRPERKQLGGVGWAVETGGVGKGCPLRWGDLGMVLLRWGSPRSRHKKWGKDKTSKTERSQHIFMILKVSVLGARLTVTLRNQPARFLGSLGKSDHPLNCIAVSGSVLPPVLKPPLGSRLLVHCSQEQCDSQRCRHRVAAYVLIAQPLEVQVPRRQSILLFCSPMYVKYTYFPVPRSTSGTQE